MWKQLLRWPSTSLLSIIFRNEVALLEDIKTHSLNGLFRHLCMMFKSNYQNNFQQQQPLFVCTLLPLLVSGRCYVGGKCWSLIPLIIKLLCQEKKKPCQRSLILNIAIHNKWNKGYFLHSADVVHQLGLIRERWTWYNRICVFWR